MTALSVGKEAIASAGGAERYGRYRPEQRRTASTGFAARQGS